MSNEERSHYGTEVASGETAVEAFYPNGILADTGLPLSAPINALAQAAKAESYDSTQARLSSAKNEESKKAFGVIEGDPTKLESSGWGVVFHAHASQDVKSKLKPLIEHRTKQAGSLCKVFENSDGYRPDESCTQWLARHGVSLDVVDPYLGVPFYLMLVGSPEEIPFEFQYLLDIYWGVGRLYFDDVDDYGRYAQSVVDYETSARVPNSKSVAIFSTAHDFDQATQMFSNFVATPLAKGDGVRGPLGQSLDYHIEAFIGSSAMKDNLKSILCGRLNESRGPIRHPATPALLLSGTHGMAFSRKHPCRQVESQGALVCQDWSGYGSIHPDDYFSASDVPADAQLRGLIHFLFACYGAGCPQFDNFPEQLNSPPKEIALKPLISRLPQKLLAHPNGGALAVFGHVDRAWSYSFHSAKAGPQIQGFRDVMGRLLRGDPIGLATDQFDVRRAALSAELADKLRDVSFGGRVPDRELVRLWIARNDARDYIVLGDPAVKLRVGDLVNAQ